MEKFIEKYDASIGRVIEILIGSITWLAVTMPIWASFLIPNIMAYFIISMSVYWLWKSMNYSLSAIVGYYRVKRDSKIDWVEMGKKLKKYDEVKHIILILNYKELEEKLAITISHIADQTLNPKKNIAVVLGMEEREGENGHQKAENLIKRYRENFAEIFATFHPEIEGEVAGKSSNEAWAGKKAKEILIEEKKWDMNLTTITSCDADSLFDRQYFACLSYKFLTDSEPYKKFWQAYITEYANLERTVLPIQLMSAISSVIRMSYSLQGEFFFPYTTYSASLKMIDEVGYWDTNIIPEDWHMFFKAFFKKNGEVKTEAINLTVHGDAIEGENFMDALKNRYVQNRRHAWGVTDIPYIIKQFVKRPRINFFKKLFVIFKVYETHFLWPTSWFLLTLGINLPLIINHSLKETVIGYNFPKIASKILTFTLIFTFTFVILDRSARPHKSFGEKWYQKIISLLQWFLMPVITLFLSTLPGLDAHTKLLLNQKIEYIVAPKKVGSKKN